MTPGELLLRRAFAGVAIIVCPRCRGLGSIGLVTLRCSCPRCRGCGESTNGINIEQGSLANEHQPSHLGGRQGST
jgi:Zn-finger nucleic acid-binding protein